MPRHKQLVIFLFESKKHFLNWSSLGKSMRSIWEIDQYQSVHFSCVISTLCIPNLEYQLVNPTTQVALFSFCSGNCSTIRNITWNVYQGSSNQSSNLTQWTLYNQMNSLENIWFFGRFVSLYSDWSFGWNFFLKVDIRRILLPHLNYFLQILISISGDLKLSILLQLNKVEVHWISSLINLHRMELVQ